MKILGPDFHLGKTCEPILRALPCWFGIEDAILNYIEAIEKLPTFISQLNGETVGFLSLKIHNKFSAEIYVIGVLEKFHRRGIGKALVTEAEKYLRKKGIEFLQVKTIAPSHPSEEYARTRKFYSSLGFKPLEEFATLWGKENPCLQMVKSI